jgi:hypothetical protein
VKVADFNRDGKLDFAVGTDQGIFFFAGNGDGTFKSPILTPTFLSVVYLSVGDFNGDGKPDLVFAGPAGGEAVALGDGKGAFKTPVEFQPTYYPRTSQVPLGDFNADGSSDLMQFSTPLPQAPSQQTASVWFSAPTVALSASGLDFDSQTVGTHSSPRSIVLTNMGNAPLLIAKIATAGEFTETNNCASRLPVGRGCTINVTFTPSAKGLANGKLTVTDNGAGGSQIIPLSGTGT